MTAAASAGGRSRQMAVEIFCSQSAWRIAGSLVSGPRAPLRPKRRTAVLGKASTGPATAWWLTGCVTSWGLAPAERATEAPDSERSRAGPRGNLKKEVELLK